MSYHNKSNNEHYINEPQYEKIYQQQENKLLTDNTSSSYHISYQGSATTSVNATNIPNNVSGKAAPIKPSNYSGISQQSTSTFPSFADNNLQSKQLYLDERATIQQKDGYSYQQHEQYQSSKTNYQSSNPRINSNNYKYDSVALPDKNNAHSIAFRSQTPNVHPEQESNTYPASSARNDYNYDGNSDFKPLSTRQQGAYTTKNDSHPIAYGHSISYSTKTINYSNHSPNHIGVSSQPSATTQSQQQYHPQYSTYPDSKSVPNTSQEHLEYNQRNLPETSSVTEQNRYQPSYEYHYTSQVGNRHSTSSFPQSSPSNTYDYPTNPPVSSVNRTVAFREVHERNLLHNQTVNNHNHHDQRLYDTNSYYSTSSNNQPHGRYEYHEERLPESSTSYHSKPRYQDRPSVIPNYERNSNTNSNPALNTNLKREGHHIVQHHVDGVPQSLPLSLSSFKGNQQVQIDKTYYSGTHSSQHHGTDRSSTYSYTPANTNHYHQGVDDDTVKHVVHRRVSYPFDSGENSNTTIRRTSDDYPRSSAYYTHGVGSHYHQGQGQTFHQRGDQVYQYSGTNLNTATHAQSGEVRLSNDVSNTRSIGSYQEPLHSIAATITYSGHCPQNNAVPSMRQDMYDKEESRETMYNGSPKRPFSSEQAAVSSSSEVRMVVNDTSSNPLSTLNGNSLLPEQQQQQIPKQYSSNYNFRPPSSVPHYQYQQQQQQPISIITTNSDDASLTSKSSTTIKKKIVIAPHPISITAPSSSLAASSPEKSTTSTSVGNSPNKLLPKPADTMSLNPMSTVSKTSSKVISTFYNDLFSKRRYICEVCSKRFTRPSSLKTHMNSHTGERPYECTIEGCGKRFSVSSNLKRHMRMCAQKLNSPSFSTSDHQQQQEETNRQKHDLGDFSSPTFVSPDHGAGGDVGVPLSFSSSSSSLSSSCSALPASPSISGHGFTDLKEEQI